MKTAINILKNRVECMNGVKSYINEVVPKLIEELEKGFKTTGDHKLFKKDADRMRAIIDSVPHFRAYLDVSEYNISLNVDNHYKDSEFGCCYYKEYTYLMNVSNRTAYTPEHMELVSLEQLENAKSELSDLEEAKHRIESKISTLKRLLN